MRLHGDGELYVSGHGDAALDGWAARIRDWHSGKAGRTENTVAEPGSDRAAGRDVYFYFDNDVKTRAPYDAMALARRLDN